GRRRKGSRAAGDRAPGPAAFGGTGGAPGRRPPMTFAFHPADWILLSPELFLTAAGLLLLGLAAAFGKKKEEFLAFLSVLFLAVTAALVVWVAAQAGRKTPILGGAFVADNFALFFKGLVL